MLIIDESGQAVPQSALGAIYRTRRAVVVGDPLQVEPVVTIPKVLIDILADSTGVAKAYKMIENSAQTFADNMNEFNGMIGKRRVGCPLVVHRRCIEPMFSISNLIFSLLFVLALVFVWSCILFISSMYLFLVNFKNSLKCIIISDSLISWHLHLALP